MKKKESFHLFELEGGPQPHLLNPKLDGKPLLGVQSLIVHASLDEPVATVFIELIARTKVRVKAKTRVTRK